MKVLVIQNGKTEIMDIDPKNVPAKLAGAQFFEIKNEYEAKIVLVKKEAKTKKGGKK